jgi:hypothetical protein
MPEQNSTTYVFENAEIQRLHGELLKVASDHVLFNKEGWAKLILPLRKENLDVTYPLGDLEQVARTVFPDAEKFRPAGPFTTGGRGLTFTDSPSNWHYISHNGFICYGYPNREFAERSYAAHTDGTFSWIYSCEKFIEAVTEGRRENRY